MFFSDGWAGGNDFRTCLLRTGAPAACRVLQHGFGSDRGERMRGCARPISSARITTLPHRILSEGVLETPCEIGFEAVAKMEQVDTQKVENSLSQFVEAGVSNPPVALSLNGFSWQSWQEILAEGDGAFIKMIVLECTELPHYAARLRRVSGLPVLDLVTCANFFAKVLVGSFSLAGDYPHHSSSNS